MKWEEYLDKPIPFEIGVRYHSTRFEKMPCDVIFDLDAINRVEDL
jgi:hypothetical protein